MGKSTVSGFFERAGVPVHDADAAVHRVMAPDGPAYQALCAAYPYYEYPDLYDRKTKSIQRNALGALVFGNEEERARLESILHPFVREDQKIFTLAQKRLGRKLVVLDIPLLFETDADLRLDYTACVTAPFFIQEKRVMARPGMTAEKFRAILKRQMPDQDKLRRADFIIDTGLGYARTARQVNEIIQTLTGGQAHYA